MVVRFYRMILRVFCDVGLLFCINVFLGWFDIVGLVCVVVSEYVSW